MTESSLPLPEPAASTEGGRRLDIQGLRAVAVLMVVCFHAGLPVPGGFVGVDVFFVISGFVITAMLHREWLKNGRIRFGLFYLRRFKRLTPALALMISVTVLISALVLSPLGTQQTAAKSAIGAVLLVGNFVIAWTTGGYFGESADTNPLLNTWSLSVEEQFYLAFPALIGLGWHIARRRGILRFAPYFFVASIAVFSFGLAVLTSTGWALPHASWLLSFYSPVTRAWEFAVGSLLALILSEVTHRSRTIALALGLLGTAMLVASLWLITETTPFPGAWTLLPVAGTLLLLFVGKDNANPVSQVLTSKPMVKIGDWSYSIYLWHWPFIVFAGILWPGSQAALLSAAALSFVPALASYVWVEQLGRTLSWVSGRRLPYFVLATIFTPLVTAVFLGAMSRIGPWSLQRQIAMAEHAPTERGCMTDGPFTSATIADCEWNSTASGQPVYLVGDSNAWHFAEAAIGAGEQLGRPVWSFTTPSCPLISGLEIVSVRQSKFFPGIIRPHEFDHCSAYVRTTLRWLDSASPGTVIVAALDQYWWDLSFGISLKGGERTTDPERKATLLKVGLTSTVKRLRAAGHQVVLVQTIPTYRNPTPIWDPRSCTAFSVYQGTCFRSVPLKFITELQQASRAAVDEAGQITGSTVLDLRSWFCNLDSCSTQKNSVSQYQDATHISVAGSRALVPLFADAINARK